MKLKNVTSCTDIDHKVRCLAEAMEAVRRTQYGNEVRNGRVVSIRDAISDPCTCHVDALLWLVSDMLQNSQNWYYMLSTSTITGRARAHMGDMH